MLKSQLKQKKIKELDMEKQELKKHQYFVQLELRHRKLCEKLGISPHINISLDQEIERIGLNRFQI